VLRSKGASAVRHTTQSHEPELRCLRSRSLVFSTHAVHVSSVTLYSSSHCSAELHLQPQRCRRPAVLNTRERVAAVVVVMTTVDLCVCATVRATADHMTWSHVYGEMRGHHTTGRNRPLEGRGENEWWVRGCVDKGWRRAKRRRWTYQMVSWSAAVVPAPTLFVVR
jgi:hypothetical protein